MLPIVPNCAQHPAHFKASYVDANAFHLFNESGVAPPMDYIFTSGVAHCNIPFCDPGYGDIHFGAGNMQMFRAAAAPGVTVIAEGTPTAC
jgi:hypothetical protein